MGRGGKKGGAGGLGPVPGRVSVPGSGSDSGCFVPARLQAYDCERVGTGSCFYLRNKYLLKPLTVHFD